MLSKLDQELRFDQTALDVRARRQEVIASNLANADTPNYKARDIDFASTLKSALGMPGGSLALAATSSRHMGSVGGAGGAMGGDLLYRSAMQPSLDGNTVDPDIERANFSDNAMHYQFLLESMGSKFHTMALAVSPDK